MAKIIDLSQTQRPAPNPVLGGEPSPGQALPVGAQAGFGELGRSVQAGAENIMQAQKVEEERVNNLRAEDAYTQALGQADELTFGENGFTTKKGADAVGKPLFKEYTKKFDDVEQTLAAGLTNDDQKLRFKQRMNVARQRFQEDILRHLAGERVNYGKQVYAGVVDTAVRDAVSRWDSPNDIAASLVRIEDAVHERADSEGWPPEMVKATIAQEAGKVHAAVVQQAIASGNYRYAQAWYEKNRDSIDLATAKVLQKAVQDGAQKELTDGYNSTYLENEDSYGSLEKLRKTVLADGTLDDARKNILVGRIQNRQQVLERRVEVAQEKRNRIIERQLTGLNASTLDGFEPSPEQFAPLLAAAKGTELEGDVHQAIALAASTRSFRNAPPLAQERILAEAEAGVRTQPTKFDARVVSAWRTIHDAQRQQLQADPVSFAVRQGLVRTPDPVDLSQPEQASDALRQRFDIARAVSARYQAPFKPLTTEEAKVLTTQLAAASVDQKRGMLARLRMSAGDDTQGYMGLMAQIAPDEPVVAIAGSIAARGRDKDSDLMLRGESILRPGKKSDGKPDGSGLYPMPPEQDLRQRFDDYVREAFSGKPEARNAHYQAAKAVYAAMSVDAGDRDTKVLNADRWEQAINMAIGQIEKYNGRRVVLPAGHDYSSFRDGLRERLDTLAASGRLDPSWTAGRLRDLPLENVGDGRYVLKSGDGVVVAPQDFGRRPDGTPKGAGFLGVRQRPDGNFSTELSIGVNLDGKEMEIPTMVPTLSGDEAKQLLSLRHDEKIPQPIVDKAVAFARSRLAAGKPVFATREESPMPVEPVIIDFNQPLPYRFSGERAGITAAAQPPSELELEQAGAPGFTAFQAVTRQKAKKK